MSSLPYSAAFSYSLEKTVLANATTSEIENTMNIKVFFFLMSVVFNASNAFIVRLLLGGYKIFNLKVLTVITNIDKILLIFNFIFETFIRRKASNDL